MPHTHTHINTYINTFALLDACKTDSTDDRDEHEVRQHRLEIHGWNQDTDDSGKGRLTGFDNLLETNSTDCSC
jgi:hypothetical protein